jgi:parallel beta-helix repeat protein
MTNHYGIDRRAHRRAHSATNPVAAGLAAALMVATVGLASLPSAAVAAVPGQPPNKFACTRITAHGAIANDLIDDTAAIQRAVNAAKTTAAKCVFIPTGTFRITRFTIDGGVRMIGNRDSSVLYAPNPANRQMKLDGDGVGIYSLRLVTPGTRRTNDNEAVWIQHGARNWVVDDLTIDGGNGPGIITYGGFNGRITRNRIRNTKSDSIHISGGAHHIYVAGNHVRNSGDDCIAVVTYGYHPVNSYQVLIENNNVAEQPWGRGITVVGGEHVTIRNNIITRSSDAGIYIAAESSWATRGVKNVVVSRNRIHDSPHAQPQHGQTSILVYSDNRFMIEDVLLDANTITRGRNGPMRVQPRNTRNIACRGNTSDGVSVSPQNCSGNPYPITGTTVTSALLGGITVPLPK